MIRWTIVVLVALLASCHARPVVVVVEPTLAEARAKEPNAIVVDVFAAWCPPCVSMQASTFPALRPSVAFADAMNGAAFVQLDRDSLEGENLAKELPKDLFPALVVIKKGRVVATW